MSLGRYTLGCIELLGILGPVVWAAVALRARFAPGLSPAGARLAEATIALSWLVVEGELLGSFGGFRGPILAGASILSGAAVGLSLGRGVQPARRQSATVRRSPLPADAPAVAVAIGLVASEQVVRTLSALRSGIFEFDSLTYHLPTAARWVQQGSLSPIHQIFPGSLYAYYPYNSELLHAIGMAAFGRDLLSPFMNLGFIALALLAAWCIGETRRAGPAALTAAAAVLSASQLSILGAGTALNDLPAVAMVLAMVALVAMGGHRSQAMVLAGLAALAGGWAIGAKPNAGTVVVVVAVGAVLASRPARVRAGLIWAGGLVVSGGYWYARDLITVGTPIPGVKAGFLSTPTAYPYPLTFAHGLQTGADSLSALPSEVNATLGPMWPVIAVLTVLGLVVALLPGRPTSDRAAALGGIANAAIWPFSPFTQVVYFSLRYMAGALLLGPILFVTSPPLLARRRQLAVSWLLVVVSAVSVLHAYPVGSPHFWPAALAGAATGLGLWLALTGRTGHLSPLPMLVAVVAVLAVAEPLTQRYLDGRYRGAGFHYRQTADGAVLTPVFAWAQRLQGARIGVEGGELQFPLYGADLSNYVQYVGRTGPNGGFDRITSCAAWRHAINRGHYDYVVTVPWGSESSSAPLPSPQGSWTRSDPAATPVLQPGGGVEVFRIHGRMQPC